MKSADEADFFVFFTLQRGVVVPFDTIGYKG